MLDEQVTRLDLLTGPLLGWLGRLLPLGGLRVLVDVVRLTLKEKGPITGWLLLCHPEVG